MSENILSMNVPELREECRKRGIAAEEAASKQDLIKRIILVDAGMQQTSMPPPGYKRDEEMARRKDTLEERLETEAPEVYPIDPDAFDEDREILYGLERDMLEVTDAQPGFTYCWTYYGQNGQMVWAKKALGWRVVTAGDPECKEHKEADGTRRLGDVLLMRIPTERYNRILDAQEKRRRAQQLGVSADVIDYARKHGLKVHEDLSTVKIGGNTLMDVMQKRADRRTAAKKVAMDTIDKKLRDGSVPGMEVPST